MLIRGCGDGPAGCADLIRLRVNLFRGVLQVMNHRNVLEAQKLRALIQRNERMRIVNQNAPCGGLELQPSKFECATCPTEEMIFDNMVVMEENMPLSGCANVHVRVRNSL